MLLQGGRREKDVWYLYEPLNPRPGNLCFMEEPHVLSKVQLLNAKGHRNWGNRQSKGVTWLWLISQPSFLYPPSLSGNVVPGEKGLYGISSTEQDQTSQQGWWCLRPDEDRGGNCDRSQESWDVRAGAYGVQKPYNSAALFAAMEGDEVETEGWTPQLCLFLRPSSGKVSCSTACWGPRAGVPLKRAEKNNATGPTLWEPRLRQLEGYILNTSYVGLGLWLEYSNHLTCVRSWVPTPWMMTTMMRMLKIQN